MHPQWAPQALVPVIARHQNRKGNREDCKQWVVVLSLPHDERVCFQVVHVDLNPFLHDIGMWCQNQPPNMREKESSFSVVRVGVSLAIFVVYTVVQSPGIYISLTGHSKQQHENQSQGPFRFETSVWPQSMHSCCDPEAGSVDDGEDWNV